MTFGLLAAGSCLFTDIVDQLHEDSKKVNSVERLTRHLNKGVPQKALSSYLAAVRKWVPSQPVIYIDDSDVVKPDGYKFEVLGLVRDGSKSTETKNVYEKGYHVTEACVLTDSSHPVSIFPQIHSSKEKNFTSVNDITFSAVERGAALFGKAAFVMDRGYDEVLEQNVSAGNIAAAEKDEIIELTQHLYRHIYGKYSDEMSEVNQTMNDALVLPGDKYRFKIRKQEEEIAALKQRDKKKDKQLQEQAGQLQEQASLLQRQAKQIAELKRQLEILQNS